MSKFFTHNEALKFLASFEELSELPIKEGKLMKVKLQKDDPDIKGKAFDELLEKRNNLLKPFIEKGLINKKLVDPREMDDALREGIGKPNRMQASFNNPKSVISDYILKSVVGRLLTIIDGIGLSDKQGNAIKDQVKKEIWGMERSHLPEETFVKMVSNTEIAYFSGMDVLSPEETGQDVLLES